MQAHNARIPQVSIDPATPTDAESIRRVQTQTWYATYANKSRGITEDGLRRRQEGENGEKNQERIEFWRRYTSTSDDDHAVFVAKVSDRVVGFVAPGVIDGQWRIGALYVLPRAQRSGIGSLLLEKALEWLGDKRTVYLHVADFNQSAIKFYERNGFQLTGNRFDDDAPPDANIPELEMVHKAKED